MFKERNHCRTEKVEGTHGRFLYFAVIPHRTPVHVYVRTRSASLAGATLRNLHLIKTHVDTNKNRIKSWTIFCLKQQYVKNHQQQDFKLRQTRTLPIITQSRVMWYKSEAECNTALGCFAMSPPCPSSNSCFHGKVAELLALIMPYGNTGEKPGKLLHSQHSPSCWDQGYTNAAPPSCSGTDSPRCHLPADGSWLPITAASCPRWGLWGLLCPGPCRQLVGAAVWKAQGTALFVLQLHQWH